MNPDDASHAHPPEVAQLLCFGVYSAAHAFNRVYKTLLDPLGLTYPQYLVLMLLWERDDRTVGELGDALFLESSTLTPLLKRLEASGHLARRRDGQDERVVRVTLTASGRALRARAAAVPACILEATGMSIERLVGLQRELAHLRAHLRATDPAGR